MIDKIYFYSKIIISLMIGIIISKKIYLEQDIKIFCLFIFFFGFAIITLIRYDYKKLSQNTSMENGEWKN